MPQRNNRKGTFDYLSFRVPPPPPPTHTHEEVLHFVSFLDFKVSRSDGVSKCRVARLIFHLEVDLFLFSLVVPASSFIPRWLQAGI